MMNMKVGMYRVIHTVPIQPHEGTNTRVPMVFSESDK